MRAIIAALAMALAPTAAWGQDIARGTVFEDRNQNGARDRGEPGLAGVLVSNGVAVTETDGQGRYEIPVAERSAVFVIQPEGYAVARDETNTPRFYHLHYPTPDPAAEALAYQSVAPTGPLPATIDFPLTRGGPGRRFTLLAFADPQPTTDEELTFVRDDFVREAMAQPFDVALGLGDLMNDDLSLIPRYQHIMGSLGRLVWSVAGNHELNFDAASDAYSLETYTRFFGPPRYAFNAGQATFVVLDNVHYLGAGANWTDRGPNPRLIGPYRGEIGADALAFVEAVLARTPQDRLVVMAMHIPLQGTWPGENVNTVDRDALLAMLCQRRHVVVLAGHMHNGDHRYLPCPEGAARADVHQHTLSTVSGSWWSGPMDARGIPVSLQTDGAPNGYYLIDFDGAAYRARFRPQSEPDRQMRITIDSAFYRYSRWSMRDYRWGELADRRITTDQLPAAQVFVNLFDGGPRSRVFASIAGRPEIELTRTNENDPYAEEVFFRAEGVRLNLTASPSTHLWKGPLPEDLAAGVHVVRVRAIDEFGIEHSDQALLEVLHAR
jgi:C terminal of Calcineurin-like phosphoesterase/N terminal of Calcineurin-like phosphoesterase/Calcineurin-like phosphoesterase